MVLPEDAADDSLAMAVALADASAAIARLDQALASHPLHHAFLYLVRLDAVRRQAAVDGELIDPWHLAATLEGLRLRMDPYLRIRRIVDAARAALGLHQWLVEPDFDKEGEVQRAEAMLLSIATVLGVIGPIAAFGLFYLGDRVFHLGRPQVQTLMYLMLSVAGHLTIFLSRTRGPFWSIRPAKILLIAVFGTQAVATLIAVYGLFMTPLGWKWAAFVWAYALVWFLINDRLKLIAYKACCAQPRRPGNRQAIQSKAATAC